MLPPVTKPALCLLLGASAIFGCTTANALTFNWSWTATNGYDYVNNTDLTGTVVTGTVNNLVDNALNTTGMTATFTGGFNVGQTVAYIGGNGIQVTNGSVVVPGLQAFFSSNDFSLQLEDPNGVSGIYGGYASVFSQTEGAFLLMDNLTAPTFTSAATVPGPLPVLAIPAVLLYSRKLKKRIKSTSKNCPFTPSETGSIQ